jgi:predicted enzyme related to lactoylglutathione lyase
MSLEWEQVVIDCADPLALARWWSEALGWRYWVQDTDEVEIRPTEHQLPGLIFGTVPEGKTIKNRLHLDFRPDDRDAEVDRLLGLGAVRVDVGQIDVPWVVLADPEGNEFCVLSSRRDQPGSS